MIFRIHRKFISILVVLTTLIYTALSGVQVFTPTAHAKEFIDLDKASSWAIQSIREAQRVGIFTGDDSGEFRPKNQITRQEIAALLVRVLKLKTITPSKPSFTDVEPKHWAYTYIETVYKAGYMNGVGFGLFQPEKRVTREELATLLVRSLKVNVKGKGAKLTVKDKDQISAWARDYVQAAMELKLMTGDSNLFRPQDKASREEVAVLFVRLYTKLYGPIPPAPKDTVPPSFTFSQNSDATNHSGKLVLKFSEPLYANGVKLGNGANVKDYFTYDGSAGVFQGAVYAATDDTVTLTFTKAENGKKIIPSTQLKDAAGNALVPQVITYSAALNKWGIGIAVDTTPPTISLSPQADSTNNPTRLVLTFSEPLYVYGTKLTNGANVRNYISYDGNTSKFISATYSEADRAITLTFSQGENGKKVTPSSLLTDESGNALVPQAITYSALLGRWGVNIAVDTTPPTVSISPNADANNSVYRLVLTFSEPLYLNGYPISNGTELKSHFIYSGTSGYFTSAQYNSANNSITLSFVGAENGKTITGGGAFTDQSGNAFIPQTFTFASAQSKWVTGNVDIVAPTASIMTNSSYNNSSTRLVLTFSEPLYLNGRALVNGEDVRAYFAYSGTASRFTSATYYTGSNQIVLTFNAAEHGKYVLAGGNVFKDQAGNAYAPQYYTYHSSLSRWVEGLDQTPPTASIDTYSSGNNNGTRLVLTFSEPLYVNGSALANGANVKSYVQYSGTASVLQSAIYSTTSQSITLTFSGAEDGRYIILNGTVLTDAFGNAYQPQGIVYSASLNRWTISTADIVPPLANISAVSDSNNNSTRLVITFTEPLYVNGTALANGANVKSYFPYDGNQLFYQSAVYYTGVNQVILTFTGAENGKKVVPVSLLTDAARNAYVPQEFIYSSGTNKWSMGEIDRQAPTATFLSSGSNNTASTLVLTFSEPLYLYGSPIQNGTSLKALFRYSGTANRFNDAVYNATSRTITFTFTNGGAENTAQLTMADPLLTDQAGNAYNHQVLSYSDSQGKWMAGVIDIQPPTATITGNTATQLVLTFSEPLYVLGNPLPNGANVKAFILYDGTPARYSSAVYSTNGNTITITFASPGAENGKRLTFADDVFVDQSGNEYVEETFVYSTLGIHWSKLDTSTPTVTVASNNTAGGDGYVSAAEQTSGFQVTASVNKPAMLYLAPVGAYADESALNAAKLVSVAAPTANVNVSLNVPANHAEVTDGGSYSVYAVDVNGTVSAGAAAFTADLTVPQANVDAVGSNAAKLVLTFTEMVAEFSVTGETLTSNHTVTFTPNSTTATIDIDAPGAAGSESVTFTIKDAAGNAKSYTATWNGSGWTLS